MNDRLQGNQSGFIPLILGLIILILAAIVFAFIRVIQAS